MTAPSADTTRHTITPSEAEGAAWERHRQRFPDGEDATLLAAREAVASAYPGCVVPILNGDWDAGQLIRDEIARRTL